MNKTFSRLALLLAFVLVVTACGSDDDAGDGGDSGATTTAADSGDTGDTTASGDCDITLRWIFGGVANSSNQELVATYEERNPGICVEIIEGPNSATDLFGTYLQTFEAQSSELDVLNIDVIWPGDLAEHLVDLNQYGAADVTGDHFPAIVENNTVDGELKGIPYYTDAGLLYSRSDLLEKYGYDGPPATWDELEEMATTIVEGESADNPDFVGFTWQGNAYEGLTCDALEWVKSHGGGEIVEDGVITINNPNAIAAIDRAASWIGGISPAGVTGWTEEDSRAVWQAGNAAFHRNWPYAYSLAQADDSVIKGLVTVSPLPAGPGGSPAGTLGGWQLAVSKYSEHPQEAADLALFLASEEGQKKNAIEQSLLPTIESLYQDADVLEASPFFGELFDVFTNAVARPSTVTAPNYNETSVAFFNAVHSVLTGENDAQTAIEELELDLEDITGLPSS